MTDTEWSEMDFETYLATELPALGRFAAALTGNRQDAHDVLTDTLIKISAKWPSIAELPYRDAYVRRAIVHTHLSDRRRTTRRRTAPTSDVSLFDVPVPDRTDAAGERDALRVLLAALPIRQRTALVLRFYADLDDTQIAEAMHTSPVNVRTLVSRGLARLRLAATPEMEQSC